MTNIDQIVPLVSMTLHISRRYKKHRFDLSGFRILAELLAGLVESYCLRPKSPYTHIRFLLKGTYKRL